MKTISRNSFFFSRNELAKFKRIRNFYIREYNLPVWKAEQYSWDHIHMDRKAVSL